jgi:hypothetical protein
MEFFKYKGLISKLVNSNLYTAEIITQSSQTFTHLKYFINSKELEPIKETVKHLSFENYLSVLLDNSFFQSLTKVDSAIVMELILEEASEDLVWIDDLHEIEYKESIRECLKKSLN